MPTRTVTPAPLREVPRDGLELIKAFEGIPDGDPTTVNIDAYLDPVGIWTIGWGHAILYKGEFLRGAQNRAIARSLYPGGITRAQAEALLRADLIDTSAAVLRLVAVPLSDGAFGALVSFAFNVGTGALGKSTLLRLLNAGDRAGAAQQFLAWNKGRINGVLQPLPGLTRRRRAERAMFLGENWRAAGGVASVSRGAKRAGRLQAAGLDVGLDAGALSDTRAQPIAPAAPAAPVKPRARTRTPTAPPTPAPAKRPMPRTKR
jgi:lysozyme